eukprot:UN20591
MNEIIARIFNHERTHGGWPELIPEILKLNEKDKIVQILCLANVLKSDICIYPNIIP